MSIDRTALRARAAAANAPRPPACTDHPTWHGEGWDRPPCAACRAQQQWERERDAALARLSAAASPDVVLELLDGLDAAETEAHNASTFGGVREAGHERRLADAIARAEKAEQRAEKAEAERDAWRAEAEAWREAMHAQRETKANETKA